MSFRYVTLGEISIDNKGSYGISASAVEYSEALYTYLRITDINDDGTLNKNGLKSVDDKNANKYLLKPNDVVFARTGGSTGRSYFYDGSDGEFVYAGFLIKFSLDPNKVNPKYLKYYTLSNEYKGWVNSFNTGSTRGNINAQTYANMKLMLPDDSQQKLLVDTLTSIDDKIQLNNCMNKTLEKMAQAIFKSWFVDFEPFQDGEFEDSELGRIPKGWRVGTLGELISDTLGGDWGKETSQGNFVEEVTCIRGADIPEIASGKKGKPATRFILKKNLEKKQLTEGQIIIEISGGSPTQSTGRTALITKELVDVYDKPLICTNFCRALSLKKDSYSTFVYSMLQYLYKIDLFFLYENGTTGIKNLDTNNLFNKYQIVIPTDEIMMQYEVVFNTLLKFIYKNGSQSDMLSTIRDTLLPKLMSSEIRVPIEEVQ